MKLIILCLVALQIFIVVESAVNFNTVKNSVRDQNVARLTEFVKNGASVNMVGPVCNKSLLMWGAISGADRSMKVLLEKGADPNIVEKNTGMTALMYAVKNNNKEAAKVLMEYNADKGKRDSTGKTALEMAEYYGYEDLVEIF